MAFTFKYPVYAFVESSATDSNGATTFTNPLALTCTSTGDEPLSIVAIPIFTDEAQAIAYKQDAKPPHSIRLRIQTREQLIDFLTKASSRAKYVAMDPSATPLTRDRIGTIEALVGELRSLAAQKKPT